MKKFVSLKLIVFSFILVASSVSFSAPVFQAGTGTDSTIAGIENDASGENSSAFGFHNKASGKFSSAFGFRNIASKLRSSAFGTGNKADGEDSSAFGSLNIASGKFSSAFGSQYEVTGNSSGAFGVGEYNGSYQYKNEGNNSYMIGNKNKIASGSDDNFILGNNVHIGGGINNSVALGNNSTVSASNTVSVGSSTLKRKIVNVGDGEISASSTDAVTGRQLYSGNGIDTAAWQNKLNVTKKMTIKMLMTLMLISGELNLVLALVEVEELLLMPILKVKLIINLQIKLI